MSVLIKGMKIPNNCNECPLLDWDRDYIKCKATNRHFDTKKEFFQERRVDDCPLSVAKEGEGMKEYVSKDDLRLMNVEECAGHTIDYAYGWKACIDWIKSSLPPMPEDVENTGIIIDQWKMPESCDKCPLLDWDWGSIKCKITKRSFNVDKEPFQERKVDDCPLVVAGKSKVKIDNRMDDIISRKAAMDACLDGWNKGFQEILADIKKLPSAELEPIRCRDCKYAINAGTEDMMCENVNGWVVATENDFGCILAERRNNE